VVMNIFIYVKYSTCTVPQPKPHLNEGGAAIVAVRYNAQHPKKVKILNYEGGARHFVLVLQRKVPWPYNLCSNSTDTGKG
jgi:hypothetical protein